MPNNYLTKYHNYSVNNLQFFLLNRNKCLEYFYQQFTLNFYASVNVVWIDFASDVSYYSKVIHTYQVAQIEERNITFLQIALKIKKW